MEGKIDSLIKSVNDLKITQNKLVSSINGLSDKFSSLSKKVNDLSNQLLTLSAEVEPLKARIDNIEINLKSNTPNSTDIISELIDRQNRMKNTLLFNLPESSDSNNQSQDINIVQDVLKYLDLKTSPTQIFRLGKLSSDSTKPRPLKLCFSNQQDVFDIFSSQHKLKSNSSWKDIRFSSDRTKQQQAHMSELRQELLRRRTEGESDLIIKYIKGIPKIISSKN